MNRWEVFYPVVPGIGVGGSLDVISEGFHIVGKKTTICLLTLANGFEIVGTSACVNPEDFNIDIGEYWAKKDAVNKLEQYYGFWRQAVEGAGKTYGHSGHSGFGQNTKD